MNVNIYIFRYLSRQNLEVSYRLTVLSKARGLNSGFILYRGPVLEFEFHLKLCYHNVVNDKRYPSQRE
jgi:hypothetical protein